MALTDEREITAQDRAQAPAGSKLQSRSVEVHGIQGLISVPPDALHTVPGREYRKFVRFFDVKFPFRWTTTRRSGTGPSANCGEIGNLEGLAFG